MSVDLVRIVDSIHRDKNIPKDILFEGIQSALQTAAKKHYPDAEDIQVKIDPETGKIRTTADGAAVDPPEFGLDGQMCGFLGVEFKDLETRIAQGGTDDEIAEWIFSRGLRPNRQQAVVWNEYIRKLGWRDRGAGVLEKVKAESGFADRTDIVTIFDGIAFREGHPLAPPPEPLSPEIEAALRARSAPPPAAS